MRRYVCNETGNLNMFGRVLMMGRGEKGMEPFVSQAVSPVGSDEA